MHNNETKNKHNNETKNSHKFSFEELFSFKKTTSLQKLLV